MTSEEESQQEEQEDLCLAQSYCLGVGTVSLREVVRMKPSLGHRIVGSKLSGVWPFVFVEDTEDICVVWSYPRQWNVTQEL